MLTVVLFCFFALGLIGGFYFLAAGGFHTSLNERMIGTVMNIGLLLWLFLAGPLTWFGTALVWLFIYNIVVGIVKAAMFPEGTWVGTAWICFDLLVTAACIILLFTVGVVL